ncbi:hypothetical protein IEQ34_016504 [Dendrobium chrysotoxum]|uniref:Uncharacterized protein n=1 Tax=Dendrobium chrysotoxum TaxID=161865 RepID=A0AAV7GFR2_DENCH|nr:hypothetical protein IEQ34_016504 [Dendrobium chrysotoxum]
MAVSDPSNKSFLGHHMHKNRLQEYTQRLDYHFHLIQLLMKENHMHQGSGIRKEAEQDVAKLALEIISVKFKKEASLNIHKDPTFSKLILNEY